MGNHYLNEPREPTRQDAQAVAPDVPRHRARKDRKRWCGGHVGREHVPVVCLSKEARWRRDSGNAERYGYLRDRCGWVPRWRWLREGEPIPNDAVPRQGGRYVVIQKYVYRCDHSEVCDQCGKIMIRVLGRDCPDYHERDC